MFCVEMYLTFFTYRRSAGCSKTSRGLSPCKVKHISFKLSFLLCVLFRPLLPESADGSESAFSFPPPPEEDTLPSALHAHLFCDSSEFPTPPPTPPESVPLEPELESEPPVPPSVPDQVPDAAELLQPQQQQLGPPTRYTALPSLINV